jgi:hypothetical protein
VIRLSARVHAVPLRPRPPVATACGRKVSATLRQSSYREQVTCQRCIDAMGWDSAEARLMRSIFPEPAK